MKDQTLLKLRKLKRDPTPRKASQQCEAYPNDLDDHRLTQWRLERYQRLRPEFDPYRCQHEAKFSLHGKKLCRPHAGQYLLDLLQAKFVEVRFK